MLKWSNNINDFIVSWIWSWTYWLFLLCMVVMFSDFSLYCVIYCWDSVFCLWVKLFCWRAYVCSAISLPSLCSTISICDSVCIYRFLIHCVAELLLLYYKKHLGMLIQCYLLPSINLCCWRINESFPSLRSCVSMWERSYMFWATKLFQLEIVYGLLSKW